MAVSNGANNAGEVTELVEDEDCQPLHAVAATYYVLKNTPIPNEIRELVRVNC